MRSIFIVLICAALSDRGATQESPAATATLFAAEPDHLFNRVYTALLVRRGPDGQAYGVDRLDPLLWDSSSHLLAGPSHDAALRALDALLADRAQLPAATPLQRALLQRDLWSVFDWAADLSGITGAEQENHSRLCAKLAMALRRLALPREQIDLLPDNYQRAVTAGDALAALPRDLFDAKGAWVCLDRSDFRLVAPAHSESFPRSVFAVFVRLPGGRQATLDYVASLDGFEYAGMDQVAAAHQAGQPAPPSPEFPAGTRFALVRLAILLDDQLAPCATRIVESVQLRTYPAPPAGGEKPTPPQVHEFTLRRRALLADEGGGLRPVTADEHDFVFVQFRSHGFDHLADPNVFSPPRGASIETCHSCHFLPGIHSVLSVVGEASRPTFLRVRAGTLAQRVERAMFETRRRFAWGFLRGLAVRR